MTQIILDAALASKLQEVGRGVEVRDSSGRVIGKFVPEVELCDPSGRVIGKFVPTAELSDWEPVSPDVSEEELQEREKSTEWFTGEEVLAHLKRLEKQ